MVFRSNLLRMSTFWSWSFHMNALGLGLLLLSQAAEELEVTQLFDTFKMWSSGYIQVFVVQGHRWPIREEKKTYMQSILGFFSTIIYNPRVSFPKRAFLCGAQTNPGWVGGEQSQGTLVSIVLLLFPAPSKSQESSTVYMSCCGSRRSSPVLTVRQTEEGLLKGSLNIPLVVVHVNNNLTSEAITITIIIIAVKLNHKKIQGVAGESQAIIVCLVNAGAEVSNLCVLYAEKWWWQFVSSIAQLRNTTESLSVDPG